MGRAGDGGGGVGRHGSAACQEPYAIKTLISRQVLWLLLAGGLSALAFEPLDLWPVAFIGVAVLMDRVHQASSWRQALGRGWVFGIGHFIVGFNWLAAAFTYQSGMPQWLGSIAVVAIALYLAVFPALASVLAWLVAWLLARRRAPHSQRLMFTCLFAAAWMACEWLRGTLFTGLPWNPIGVVWLVLPWVVQAARWIGTYGLSALLVLASGALWMGFTQRRLATMACASLLLLGVVVAQWRALPTPLPTRSADSIAVRIVQPNIGQDEKYDATQAERHERLYAGLSGAPGTEPRILLWPESATLRFLELEPQAVSELAALLGPHDVLLTGGNSVTLAVAPRKDTFRNSVFALDAGGAIRWRYDKAHLVPFGEYLPARVVLEHLGLSRLVPGDGDYLAGPGPQTLPVPGFSGAAGAPTVGVQICYEIIFSGHVLDESDRPWFLFNPTNDAWFGSWGPPQHLAQTRLRAIEEGITVMRAAPNGISAWISPSGRVLESIAVHQTGVIDGYISPPLPPTLFSRLGNGSCGLFGLVLLGLGMAARGRRV